MKYAISVSGIFREYGKSTICHTMLIIEAKDEDEAHYFGFKAARILYPASNGWSDYNTICCPIDAPLASLSELKEFVRPSKQEP